MTLSGVLFLSSPPLLVSMSTAQNRALKHFSPPKTNPADATMFIIASKMNASGTEILKHISALMGI